MNWDQLKTILWLRWRLTRNQMSRQGVGAALWGIIAVGACVLGAASFIAAFFVGLLALNGSQTLVLWVVWMALTIAFLFLWMIGLLQELQRSESIDLQRLMHLPVVLGQIFIVNYIASHLAFSVILLVPAMVGLSLGLAFSHGPAMLLLAPLALAMVFMISAWTYCLRGWLAALMTNPRRRRTVVMVIVMTFVLLAQAPNLYFNLFRRSFTAGPSVEAQKARNAAVTVNFKQKVVQLQSAQKFIPPLWLPASAEALSDGHPLPALLSFFGCVALGALGLWRAYLGTLRFYRGDSSRKARVLAAPNATGSVARPSTGAASRFLEVRLPGVPEQAAALAMATLRAWLRAPEVKMVWGTSFFVPLIAGGSLLFRSAIQTPETVKPFVATGAAVFSVFMLVQFFSNQFGFDRDGFRALVLCPADRKLLLLGKNLACLPVGAFFGGTLLALVSAVLHVSVLTFVAGVFQLAALLMLAALVGNVLSIFAPYRIQPGTMKPTKMPPLATLLLVACHLLFPVAMAPIFIPPLAQLIWQKAGLSPAVPVNLFFSLALVTVIAVVYWQTIGPLGLLLQRRETKILATVSVEVE